MNLLLSVACSYVIIGIAVLTVLADRASLRNWWSHMRLASRITLAIGALITMKHHATADIGCVVFVVGAALFVTTSLLRELGVAAPTISQPKAG